MSKRTFFDEDERPERNWYDDATDYDAADRDDTAPKRPFRGRIFRLLFVLVVLGILGYAGYVAYLVSKVSTQPLDLSPLARDETGRTNVLILGSGDPGHDGAGLTDTIMVLSIDNGSYRTAQISVPRDLRVTIPGRGLAKINAASVYGGAPLAREVVGTTLGIPIHYLVQTDFSGLVGLVDAVGGIDVNVETRLTDIEYPCDDDQYRSCGLDILPGSKHMDGALALKYVRCRKGTCGDDFGRAKRQQEVVGIIRDKMLDWHILADPTKLVPLVEALSRSLRTDMGAVQLVGTAKAWQDGKTNQPASLVLSTAPAGLLRNAGGSSDLVPLDGSFTAIRQRVRTIFEIPSVLPENN